jgi:hypothetical protein
MRKETDAGHSGSPIWDVVYDRLSTRVMGLSPIPGMEVLPVHYRSAGGDPWKHGDVSW